MSQMQTLARDVAALNTHPGATGTGAGGEGTATLAQYVERLGSVLGIDTSDLHGVPTEAQVLSKFNTTIAAARAQGTGSAAYATIHDFANALPNMHLTPGANAEVMANLLTLGQKERDVISHAHQYANSEPGSVNTRTYAGIIPDYQAKFPAASYDQMTQQLTRLFSDPKQAALARDLMEKYHDPRTQAALLQKFGYDPKLARVFQ